MKGQYVVAAFRKDDGSFSHVMDGLIQVEGEARKVAQALSGETYRYAVFRFTVSAADVAAHVLEGNDSAWLVQDP